MPASSKSEAPIESKARNLSTTLTNLLPHGDDDVASFLATAAVAIDAREADLARHLRVTGATMSNWKVRGRLPPKATAFFTSAEFLELIVFRGRIGSMPKAHAGIEIALEVFRRTDFNAFQRERDPIRDCARHFAGICHLCLFVAHRTAVTDDVDQWNDLVVTMAIFLLSEAGKTLGND